MFTSFHDGFSGKSDSQAQGLSLRKFLSEGVFVGVEDIWVTRCAHRAQDCRPGDVFIPHPRQPEINMTKWTRRFAEVR